MKTKSLLFLTFSALVADPKKLLYTVANPARGLLNREKKKKEKVWQRTPPPPRALLVRRKIKNKITRRIHIYISRRYEGRRYAGGLGPSRVRTRIPTTHRLGQWLSLRKILRVTFQRTRLPILSHCDVMRPETVYHERQQLVSFSHTWYLVPPESASFAGVGESSREGGFIRLWMIASLRLVEK